MAWPEKRSAVWDLRHGADLVKHMTLWSRFKRARAWEALQHSFFHVDPEDQETVPEFATMQQRPIQTLDELEEVVDHNDDYLFDPHRDLYHYEQPTFRSFIGEGVPSWIANEPMDSEDMYWYAKKEWNTSTVGRTGTSTEVCRFSLCHIVLWTGGTWFSWSVPRWRLNSRFVPTQSGALWDLDRVLPKVTTAVVLRWKWIGTNLPHSSYQFISWRLS